MSDIPALIAGMFVTAMLLIGQCTAPTPAPKMADVHTSAILDTKLVAFISVDGDGAQLEPGTKVTVTDCVGDMAVIVFQNTNGHTDSGMVGIDVLEPGACDWKE